MEPPTARLVPVVCLLALALGCATVDVDVDYDPSEDFSGYRTFGWLPGERAPSGDPRVDNPLLEGRVRAAVRRELEARGYRYAEEREADFHVAYHFTIRQKLDVYTVDYGYVNRWGYVVSLPETHVREYEQGTLVIDVANAREREFVWRGVAVGRVRDEGTPEQRTARVNQVVAEILRRFPPPR